MNSTSSARASANSDRYSRERADRRRRASMLGSDARAQHVALGAARGERHDHRGRDHGDRDHRRRRARCDAGRPRDGRRETRTPLDAAARCSDRIRSSRVRHASHSRLASRPAMPERGLDRRGERRPGRGRAARSRSCGRRTARTRPSPSATGTAPYAARDARATTAGAPRRCPPGTRRAPARADCGTSRRAGRP